MFFYAKKQKEIDSFIEEVSYGISGKVVNEESYDFELVDEKLVPVRVSKTEEVENITKQNI